MVWSLQNLWGSWGDAQEFQQRQIPSTVPWQLPGKVWRSHLYLRARDLMARVNYTTNYVGENILEVTHRQKHFPVSGGILPKFTWLGEAMAQPAQVLKMRFKIDCDIAPE